MTSPMLRALLIPLAGAVYFLLLIPHGLTEEIRPPFNLRWGETADRLERLLKSTKATIVSRKTIEGREAWAVEGLVQSGLKRTVFYFIARELVEVELQYQKDEWDETKYDGFMGDLHQRLDQRHGPGQLIARKKEAIGDVIQTLVGWKWNQNNSTIELIYFCAQGQPHVFRTLSIHYKTL
ncbi:MAG: hypothetical protein WCI46_08640 [Verrucomicrobiota bacterium]|jgi:hypothetical protein